jgi:hypothetical protein
MNENAFIGSMAILLIMIYALCRRIEKVEDEIRTLKSGGLK